MSRKHNRNTYIIIALICLIIFNIGTILININRERARPVIKMEKLHIKDTGIFVFLFGETSSIINIHRHQIKQGKNWDNSSYGILSIVNEIKRLFNNQFPAILSSGKASIPYGGSDSGTHNKGPIIMEDFIIIDRIEEYEDFIILQDSEGNLDVPDLPRPLNINTLKINKEKPYILIYHTHGTESYSSLENKLHHTTDKRFNVLTIGEIVAKTLERNGHKVEHVKKYHDVPSYNKSYSESLKTMEEKIKDNNNLKILIDIHRDGYDHNDPKVIKNLKNLLDKSRIEIKGKKLATFYFVIGPDSQNMDAVLNFAKYIKAVSDIVYPGICTGIMIKPVGKYNQFLSDYSILVEVGNNLNPIEEAMETGKVLGEILGMVIEKIQE